MKRAFPNLTFVQEITESCEASVENTFRQYAVSPEIVGGAEVSVSLLAEALAAGGHEVTAVCLHNGPDTAIDQLKGVNVYRLPIDNYYWPFGRDRRHRRCSGWAGICAISGIARRRATSVKSSTPKGPMSSTPTI